MRFTRQLSRWIKKWFQPTRPIQRPATLKLDALEAREVPATFNVTNLLDTNAAGSLRWAINQSNAATASANTIDIKVIGQLNLTATLPTVTHQVTIDNITLGSFTINGGNKYQILTVGAPIALDFVNLDKGVGANGGAIDVTKAVSVTLHGCNVSADAATVNGGGIFSSGGDLTLNHTIFNGNKAGQFGGAVMVQNANVTLVTTYLTGNSAHNGGGLYVKNGTAKIETASEVEGNVAGGAMNGGGGVAASTGAVSVIDSLVNGNAAKEIGGGIWVNNGNVSIENQSQVDSNVAVSKTSTGGGGIWDRGGNVDLTGSYVNGNTAKGSGGGIFAATGNVTINYSYVNSNKSSNGYGGGVWAQGNVVAAGNAATQARINGNSALWSGAGIYSESGTVSLANGEVNINVAAIGDGGGIYDANGNVTVNSGGEVNSNSTNFGNGGGIYVLIGNVTIAAKGEVNSNVAYSNGGGIYDADGNVNIAGQVNGNIAERGAGGGIYAAKGNVNILPGGQVDHNKAHVEHTGAVGGGGNTGGAGGNTGGGGGGFTSGGIGNTGGQTGGNTGGHTGGNTGENGNTGGNNDTGGNDGGDTGGNDGGDTGGNDGGDTGGADSDAARFKPKPFTTGALMGGGGIYALQGNVTVAGGQVSANNVYGVGAGICAPAGTVSLTGGAQLEQNGATGVGGGVFDIAPASTQGVNVTDATVAGNVSLIDGGGIYVRTGTVNVLDSTISGNSAELTLGGGIQNADAKGAVTVTNSTIGANTAQTAGGGIHAAGTVTVNNSTIALNVLAAGGEGAGIRADGALDIDNTIVAGNYAGTAATEQDISGTAVGEYNVIGNAAAAGGLVNGTNNNIVGVNGTGTRPVSTIIHTNLANNGGLTDTYALAINSVAAEAGDSALNPASVGNFDQRGAGFPRTANGKMDIGAI
jgi:hypothetical protein